MKEGKKNDKICIPFPFASGDKTTSIKGDYTFPCCSSVLRTLTKAFIYLSSLTFNFHFFFIRSTFLPFAFMHLNCDDQQHEMKLLIKIFADNLSFRWKIVILSRNQKANTTNDNNNNNKGTACYFSINAGKIS